MTAEELAARKSEFIGSHQVGLSNAKGLAQAILETVLRGYDLAYLDQYPAAVEAVTVSQVNAAIHAHLEPNQMVLIKAGTVLESPAR